jgi:hypothetical protein
MFVTVKAVYRDGVFRPLEPVDELEDCQEVQLQAWPLPLAGEEEVAPGIWPRELTPGQIQSRREAVRRTRGLVALDDPELALQIATDDELLEWNLPL